MRNTLTIIALVAAFAFGRYTVRTDVVTVTEDRVVYDTIVRTDVRVDTVTRERVVYRDLPIVRHDTVVLRDTVKVAVPIYHYVKRDSLYYIEAEGYDVRFKRIEVYPRTVYQTRTITKQPSRWGVGVQVGIGATDNGLSPYVGVGVQYHLIRF